MINPIITLVGIIFLINIQTYASNQKIKLTGGVDGGGGKVVVFKDEKNQITKVQLLDLWEAEYLYGLKPVKLGNTVQEIVDNGILALKNSFDARFGSSNSDGEYCEAQDCIVKNLKFSSKKFFSDNSDVKRLHGIELIQTNDSFELAKPKNAEIHQIVNYRPDGKVLIDQDLLDLMDIENQAALILHEIYYSYLREPISGFEINSIRTRRSIGYVLSGGIFNLDKQPEFKKSVVCKTQNDSFGFGSRISLFQNPSYDNFFSVYIYKAHGSSLIGSYQPFVSFNFSNSNEFLFTGDCDNAGSGAAMMFNGNGPVEFDHIFKIEFKCENKKLKTFFTETKQGSKEFNSELFCEY